MVPSPPATMTLSVLMYHIAFILEISSIPVVVYNANSILPYFCKSEVASIISDLSIPRNRINNQYDILFKVLFLLLIKNN
jgi:hypothetical protein